MYAAKIVFMVIIALGAQFALATLTSPRFNYVDLPLIVTVYFALRRSQLLGMTTGAVTGLVEDAISHSYMGVGGLTKTVIGYFVATINLRVELDNFLVRLLTLGIAAGCNFLFFVLINKFIGVPQFSEISGRQLWRGVGIAALANLGAGIFIFLIADKVVGRPDPGKVETMRQRFYR